MVRSYHQLCSGVFRSQLWHASDWPLRSFRVRPMALPDPAVCFGADAHGRWMLPLLEFSWWMCRSWRRSRKVGVWPYLESFMQVNDRCCFKAPVFPQQKAAKNCTRWPSQAQLASQRWGRTRGGEAEESILAHGVADQSENQYDHLWSNIINIYQPYTWMINPTV